MLWHALAKDVNIDAASGRKVFLHFCLVIVVRNDISPIYLKYIITIFSLMLSPDIVQKDALSLPFLVINPLRFDSSALMLQNCSKAGLSFFGRFGLAREKRTPDLIAAAGGLCRLEF